MSQPGVFTGAALTSADKAGRLSVPAVLRNAIPGEAKTRQLFIAPHPKSECFMVSGADRIDRIEAEIETARAMAMTRGTDFDEYELRSELFGAGEEVPIDGSGRFVLSDQLREQGAFGSDIFLFGMGKFFEMWDVATLAASTEPRLRRQREALAAALRVRARKAAAS